MAEGLCRGWIIAVTFAAACLGPPGCAQQESRSQTPTPVPTPCVDFRHAARCHKIGTVAARQVVLSSMTWDGARVNEYVTRLGQNLACASGAKQPFTFRVLYSPHVNAQAFPGGVVFVNSGVISRAESEAELAAVLAHEIAHINACHWQRTAKRSQLFGLLAVVPWVAVSGPLGMALGCGSAAAIPIAEARFRRSYEREADRLAALYLARAGYHPRAAARMFEHLEASGTDSVRTLLGILATHPRASRRKSEVEKVVTHLAQALSWLENTSESNSIREEVLRYDAMYTRSLGEPPSGKQLSPPRLERRRSERNP